MPSEGRKVSVSKYDEESMRHLVISEQIVSITSHKPTLVQQCCKTEDKYIRIKVQALCKVGDIGYKIQAQELNITGADSLQLVR